MFGDVSQKWVSIRSIVNIYNALICHLLNTICHSNVPFDSRPDKEINKVIHIYMFANIFQK